MVLSVEIKTKNQWFVFTTIIWYQSVDNTELTYQQVSSCWRSHVYRKHYSVSSYQDRPLLTPGLIYSWRGNCGKNQSDWFVPHFEGLMYADYDYSTLALSRLFTRVSMYVETIANALVQYRVYRRSLQLLQSTRQNLITVSTMWIDHTRVQFFVKYFEDEEHLLYLCVCEISCLCLWVLAVWWVSEWVSGWVGE